MLKNKKLLVFLFLIIIVSLIYFFFFRRSAEKINQATPLPTTFPTPNPIYFEPTKHQALIYEDPSKNFSINEIQANNSYQIVIIGIPFSQYREEAENAFLSLLRISKENACKLNATITTPYFANPDKSGIIYPLSFCPQP